MKLATAAFGLTIAVAGGASAMIIDLTEDSADVTMGSFYGTPNLSFTVDLPSSPIAHGETLSYDVTFSTPFVTMRPYYGSFGYLVDFGDPINGFGIADYFPVETTSGYLNPAIITGVDINFTNLSIDETYDGGPYHVVLTEVPEPGSWTLMLLGLGAIGSAARFRSKGSRSRL